MSLRDPAANWPGHPAVGVFSREDELVGEFCQLAGGAVS